MKTRYPGILLVVLATLLSFQAAHAAPTLTFSLDTLPSGGALSGAPGKTVGWGYTITNLDLANWLVVSTLTASSFISADPNPLGIFDFPIVPPNTTVTTPYVSGIAGLYEVTVKSLPPVSFESGLFTVAGDWFDGDPFEGGSMISSGQQKAPYSLTVSALAVSVPEPSTLLLLVTGLGSLVFLEMLAPVRSHRRRSMRIRLALFLVAAAALPMLVAGHALAGGGFNPPPAGFVLAPPTGQITAVIVLDPNGPVSFGAPATPTGTFGSIAITRKHVGTATATFQVQPGSTLGELVFGCNLLLTNSRFVEQAPGVPGLPIGGPPLSPTGNWLLADVTANLFAQLGVTLQQTNTNTLLLIPVIAGVISQKCVPFPDKDDTLEFLMLSELLEKRHIKPLPPKYPDLTIVPAPANPAQQWFPGFLVLEVTIGFLTGGAPSP